MQFLLFLGNFKNVKTRFGSTQLKISPRGQICQTAVTQISANRLLKLKEDFKSINNTSKYTVGIYHVSYIFHIISVIYSPVHGQLGHECNIGLVCAGFVLIVQEVEMCTVHSETLSSELITRIVLIKLQQSLLELKRKHKIQLHL